MKLRPLLHPGVLVLVEGGTQLIEIEVLEFAGAGCQDVELGLG